MMMELNKLYEQMYLQISLDNEAYADKKMKSVYKEIKKAMNDTISKITDLFVEYGVDGKLNLTSKQKANIRKQLSEYLKQTGKLLAESEIDQLTSTLEDIAKETYYLTAYVMSYGLKSQLKFPLIRQEFIDSIINAEFKGETFSSRIWKNKDGLIKKLRLSIEDAMKGQLTVDQVARTVKKEFAVTTYESRRLSITETCRVQVKAQEEIGKNAGVKRQLFTATLDGRTSDICRQYDQKIFDIDDPNKPVLPLHPFERSLFINMIEGWSPKVRKDNETKQLINYQDYEEWLQSKGI
jgi:SPP1 gp7 family putative phage head morphogenesis protein